MRPQEFETDVLIVGGGTGACAAAMAATSLGVQVIMTEETSWIGGQLTSQAVPPDEHPWIESFGCTRRYRTFREMVRQFYRDHYPLTPEARKRHFLNPGSGWVSRICMEPRVALATLEAMLAYPRANGMLEIWLKTIPTAAQTDGDKVTAVQFLDLDTGEEVIVKAKYVLDATELGDLLAMTDTEYHVGAESFGETKEKHDPGRSNRKDIQGFTWCFAMGFEPGGQNVIEKPEDYDYWNNFTPETEPEWPGKLFSWTVPDAATMAPRTFPMFGDLGMFTYRQIIDSRIYAGNDRPHDVTIVNWAQNDYFFEPVIDVSQAKADRALFESRQQSLSFFYWLQTEAPRDEGGYGYPELYLVPEVLGTRDGFALAPYHRESRRIKAEFIVTENHVGVIARKGHNGAEKFSDSIGVGAYRIDLHPSAVRNSIDLASYPFQIPLGSLIPVRIENLLPACKNIGSTHITNGCYRLHPVEWNIGEAAGLLAAHCYLEGLTPRQVRNTPNLLEDFQRLCVQQGFELDWPAVRPL
jgi:hypothetical protein